MQKSERRTNLHGFMNRMEIFFLLRTILGHFVQLLAYDETRSSASAPVVPMTWPDTEDEIANMGKNKVILQVLRLE